MANHSLITLKTAIQPAEVEAAVAEINKQRFDGRLHLSSTLELTRGWKAARAWVVEVPDTRPEKPSPFAPDENLGFCFWLHRDGLGIETRHDFGTLTNGWIRWIMYIHEHELAKHFGVTRFDGGDGPIKTDPAKYKGTFYEYAVRSLKKPLSTEDEAYVQGLIQKDVPEGWR